MGANGCQAQPAAAAPSCFDIIQAAIDDLQNLDMPANEAPPNCARIAVEQLRAPNLCRLVNGVQQTTCI